jgi:hypothetical protein
MNNKQRALALTSIMHKVRTSGAITERVQELKVGLLSGEGALMLSDLEKSEVRRIIAELSVYEDQVEGLRRKQLPLVNRLGEIAKTITVRSTSK